MDYETTIEIGNHVGRNIATYITLLSVALGVVIGGAFYIVDGTFNKLKREFVRDMTRIIREADTHSIEKISR